MRVTILALSLLAVSSVSCDVFAGDDSPRDLSDYFGKPLLNAGLLEVSQQRNLAETFGMIFQDSTTARGDIGCSFGRLTLNWISDGNAVAWWSGTPISCGEPPFIWGPDTVAVSVDSDGVRFRSSDAEYSLVRYSRQPSPSSIYVGQWQRSWYRHPWSGLEEPDPGTTITLSSDGSMQLESTYAEGSVVQSGKWEVGPSGFVLRRFESRSYLPETYSPPRFWRRPLMFNLIEAKHDSLIVHDGRGNRVEVYRRMRFTQSLDSSG